MKISKSHQTFFQQLNQPNALTNPEKYLGPNYKDVLNFWIYLDTLSDQEKEGIADRYWNLDYNALVSAIDDANVAAEDVVGREFGVAAWDVAWNVTGWGVFGTATVELIGSHKLLEQGKTPTVLSLCVNN